MSSTDVKAVACLSAKQHGSLFPIIGVDRAYSCESPFLASITGVPAVQRRPLQRPQPSQTPCLPPQRPRLAHRMLRLPLPRRLRRFPLRPVPDQLSHLQHALPPHHPLSHRSQRLLCGDRTDHRAVDLEGSREGGWVFDGEFRLCRVLLLCSGYGVWVAVVYGRMNKEGEVDARGEKRVWAN